MIMYGSPMGDSNLHNHRRCPLILLGKANGKLDGNLHLKAPDGTPMANPMLSVMHTLGMNDIERSATARTLFNLKPYVALSEAFRMRNAVLRAPIAVAGAPVGAAPDVGRLAGRRRGDARRHRGRARADQAGRRRQRGAGRRHDGAALGRVARRRRRSAHAARRGRPRRRGDAQRQLHAAASGEPRRPAAIKALIKAGANVNAPTTSGGATALHFAAGDGDPEAVAALLDKGATVNARESAFQQTPLMWAAAPIAFAPSRC